MNHSLKMGLVRLKQMVMRDPIGNKNAVAASPLLVTNLKFLNEHAKI